MTLGLNANLSHHPVTRTACLSVEWYGRSTLYVTIPTLQGINSHTNSNRISLLLFATNQIKIQVDALVRFDDKSYGIIDFKTSQAAKASETYSRQLHAYARALEDPSTNSELEGGTVSDMGLVVYTPGEFHTPTTEEGAVKAALTGDLTYVPVERDDKGFERFLGEVVDVLALPGPPAPPPPSRARWGGGSFSSCPYCQFLHEAGEKGLIHGRG